MILIVDLFVNGLSFALSYFVIKQFEFPDILRGHFFFYTSLYAGISLVVFYLMRIHTGIIRYSNVFDMFRIFVAVLITGLLYFPATAILIAGKFDIHSLDIPGVLIINIFISFSSLVIVRMMIRGFYYYIKRAPSSEKEYVLVYGSDADAIVMKQAIESSDTNKFVVAGFLETNPGRVNSYIQQIRIYHLRSLPELRAKKNITKLIVMSDQLNSADKQQVIDKCLQNGIKVLTAPPSDQWVYGRLSVSQIQELRIEDLLQRDPIVIDNKDILNEISNRCILVTGAAGSIGSEIVRQVLTFNPSMVVLCDQAETPLHDLQLELQGEYPHANIKIFVGSVRDKNRMEIPFRKYHPYMVFHAAAYKHVPLMEKHPSEAILTNVLGTRIVADLSVYFHVRTFVMISTDKAVNPSNIMGTSKRIAEMYVQALSNLIQNKHDQDSVEVTNIWGRQFISRAIRSNTRFVTTRFGNVLGSNGSVIPLFRQQIARGGPVTVTHPQITRFFMTIPEAVQLVLEAAVIGHGSDIYIFDMGNPVKIVDLAYKMIRLVGLVPDEDIKVVFTGLRPGEKLFEELLNKEETTLPTHHEKIKIARVKTCTYNEILEIEELINTSRQNDHFAVVRKMKQLVPEFKSNNSRYEQLDGFYLGESAPELVTGS